MTASFAPRVRRGTKCSVRCCLATAETTEAQREHAARRAYGVTRVGEALR